MNEPKWEVDLMRKLKADNPEIHDAIFGSNAAAGEGSRHPFSQYQKVKSANGTWTSTYRYGGGVKAKKDAKAAAARACGRTLQDFFRKYLGGFCMVCNRYDWPRAAPSSPGQPPVTYDNVTFPRVVKKGGGVRAGPIVEGRNAIRTYLQGGKPVIVGLIRCSGRKIGVKNRSLIQCHCVGIVGFAGDVFLYVDTEPRHHKQKSQSHGVYMGAEREMIGHIVYKDRPHRPDESILYAPDLHCVVIWGP